MGIHGPGGGQRKEKQKWTIEKPKVDNARRLQGTYFIDLWMQSSLHGPRVARCLTMRCLHKCSSNSFCCVLVPDTTKSLPCLNTDMPNAIEWYRQSENFPVSYPITVMAFSLATIEALCSIHRSIHGFVQNCVTTRTLEIFWKIYTPAMLKAIATTEGWRRQTVKPNANPRRDSPNLPVLSPVPVFQMYLPHFQTVFYLAQDIFFASWVVIFLTPVQGRFPQKMLVESWKFPCQQQYCANFNVRSTGKFVALKRTARQNTLALWRPMNLRESVH